MAPFLVFRTERRQDPLLWTVRLSWIVRQREDCRIGPVRDVQLLPVLVRVSGLASDNRLGKVVQGVSSPGKMGDSSFFVAIPEADDADISARNSVRYVALLGEAFRERCLALSDLGGLSLGAVGVLTGFEVSRVVDFGELAILLALLFAHVLHCVRWSGRIRTELGGHGVGDDGGEGGVVGDEGGEISY